jgi:hypothetical protein
MPYFALFRVCVERGKVLKYQLFTSVTKFEEIFLQRGNDSVFKACNKFRCGADSRNAKARNSCTEAVLHI